MSHLGRPEGRPDPALSLRPVAERLRCRFAEDCVGEATRNAVGGLGAGEMILLENLRFHAGEEANDPDFARRLAALGQLYVDDAFAAAHRAHASVVGIARHLPAYAGHLMLAELAALHKALDDPRRPLAAVVGGAKVSTKAGVLRHLLPRVDALLIGGAMANTFLRGEGKEVGASLVEEELTEEAREVAEMAGDKLTLPVDAVCARSMEPGVETRVFSVD